MFLRAGDWRFGGGVRLAFFMIITYSSVSTALFFFGLAAQKSLYFLERLEGFIVSCMSYDRYQAYDATLLAPPPPDILQDFETSNVV